eukprot:10575391-Ditylum_brightwellii.AAC.1
MGPRRQANSPIATVIEEGDKEEEDIASDLQLQQYRRWREQLAQKEKYNELLAKRECYSDSAVCPFPRSAFPDKAAAQKRCYSPAAMTAAMTLSC